jgi:hypothetical protein
MVNGIEESRRLHPGILSFEAYLQKSGFRPSWRYSQRVSPAVSSGLLGLLATTLHSRGVANIFPLEGACLGGANG